MGDLYPYWKAVAVKKPDSASYVYDTFFGRTAGPALRAVFDTIELAELILGETCMRDILISVQRVCKRWTSTIDRSPIFQEALFFRPMNAKRLIYRGNTSDEHIDIVINRDIAACTLEDSPYPIFEHPMITNKCSKVRKYHDNWYAASERDVMGHPDASWRRQLITQSPLAERGWWDYKDDVKVTGSVRANAGLTMGDFVKGRALRFYNRHEKWSWQTSSWDAPCVATIELARFAGYTEGQWVAE